jgi:GntR family transcriptional repressor for pyruvate dehydrogenase complex
MLKSIHEPLRIRSLPEIVETRMRELILEGNLVPGERLPTERELCKQFGVSMVTAREALKGLQALGLIEKRKGRRGGIFVAQAKSDSLKIPLYSFLRGQSCSSDHLTQLRLIIEPAVVKIAASCSGEETIKALEENVGWCECTIAEVGPSLTEEQFFDIEKRNVEFHRLMAEATKNPALILTVDYVMDFLFELKHRILTADFNLTLGTINEHRNILSCVKDRDIDGAEKRMIVHLERLQQCIGAREKALGPPQDRTPWHATIFRRDKEA